MTVQPRNEKARRGAVLPLSGDPNLATDLRNLFASRPIFLLGNADPHAFPSLPSKGAEMLRADMHHARNCWRVAQYRRFRRKGLSRQNARRNGMNKQGAPRTSMSRSEARNEIDSLDASDFLQAETSRDTADFHALRHTFGTWLAQSGVHPKVCQKMMRHASIDTTMQLYTHTLLDDKDKAARALPDIGIRNDQGDVGASAAGVA